MLSTKTRFGQKGVIAFKILANYLSVVLKRQMTCLKVDVIKNSLKGMAVRGQLRQMTAEEAVTSWGVTERGQWEWEGNENIGFPSKMCTHTLKN